VPGATTSNVEVTRTGTDGFCLRVGDEELRLAFTDFPWFRHATESELRDVSRPQPHHLYWPALDIDLALDSIRHPEQYPLVAKSGR
jgi:hypothetical protein